MRLTYRIELNTRAINFNAVVTFAAMGKYVTDFLSPYRRSNKGYTVTRIDESGVPIGERGEP